MVMPDSACRALQRRAVQSVTNLENNPVCIQTVIGIATKI